MKRWQYLLAGLVMVAASTFLLYWCFSKIDGHQFIQALSHANILWLLLGVICVVVIIFFNMLQWQLFLLPNSCISIRRLWRVVAVMLMMANFLPWGNAFAVYHLGHLERVGKTVALSVMTLDQITEGFAKLIVFLIVSLIIPLPVWMKSGISTVVGGVLASYLLFLFFAYRYRSYKEGTHARRWRDVLSRWGHHLHGIRNLRITIYSVALACVMKFGEILAVYCVQLALGVSLPLWVSLFIVAAINLATLVPVTPGNLGIYEAAVFFVYQYVGLDASLSMTLAILTHAVYLVGMILPGYAVVLRAGMGMSRVFFYAGGNPKLEPEDYLES